LNSGLLVGERELTFTFAICYRPSVRPSVCLSVCLLSVCRLSVRNTRAPYSGGWNFRQYFYRSTAFDTLAIPWHPQQILRRSSQGNPSAGETQEG